MLDEIIVTASRVGQKLSDTSVTISVIDEKEIEKVKYRNPDEILRRIPGVYTHDFGLESEQSSALYGNNHISGVINVIFKKTSPQPEVKESVPYMQKISMTIMVIIAVKMMW